MHEKVDSARLVDDVETEEFEYGDVCGCGVFGANDVANDGENGIGGQRGELYKSRLPGRLCFRRGHFRIPS